MIGEADVWAPGEVLALDANAKRATERFIATEGQTLFTILGFTYTRNTGSLAIYKNGDFLGILNDFQEVSNNQFALNVAASAGDVIDAEAFVEITGDIGSPFPLPMLTEKQVLASAQTVVVLTVLTTTYTAFYISGPNVDTGRLIQGTDYTVDNTTQITLSESYPAGTEILVVQSDPSTETFVHAPVATVAGLRSGLDADIYNVGDTVELTEAGKAATWICRSGTATDNTGTLLSTVISTANNKYLERKWGWAVGQPINATWFDAKGDGSTIDTAALAAASLAASQAIFKKLYIPGTDNSYVTDGAWNVYADMEVFGDGKASLIKHTANSNCMYINAVDDVYVHDLAIQGTNFNGIATSEILLRIGEQVNNITVERCYFFESGRNGISIQQNAAGRNPTNIKILTCDFYDNRGNGLFYNGVIKGLISGCTFNNNGTSAGLDASNVGYGLVVDAYWDNDPSDVKILGCDFKGNSQGDIIVLVGTGIVIGGCTFADTGSSAFIDPGQNYGNAIYIRWKDASSDNRTQNGYPKDTTIYGCTIRRCYGSGIKCENGEGYNIGGVTIRDAFYNNTSFTNTNKRAFNMFSTGSNIIESITIDDVIIKGTHAGAHHYYGMYFRGVQYGSIANCHVYDSERKSMIIDSDGSVFNRGLEIEGNMTVDTDGVTGSISCNYLDRSHIHGNNLHSWSDGGTFGIELDSNSTGNKLGKNFFYGLTAGKEYNISNVPANDWVQEWAQTGVWDFAVDGGDIDNYTLGTLPINTYIVEAWYEVLTPLTSAGAATVEIGVITNDSQGIAVNAAYNNAQYSSGLHDGIPDGSVANFTTKTDAVRGVALKIEDAALTAGKVRVWWRYVQSEA